LIRKIAEESLKKRTVLVTGGAGYIGAHTCKALCRHGYLPVVYDNLVYGHRNFAKWGPFHKGDIQNRKKLTEILRQYEPCGVIHFAAFAYVGESVTDPGKYYQNNVVGSLSLLEAMRDSGVTNLVFSSSCAVYGNPVEVPIPETHPLNPINPYGRTKLIMENMMHDFSVAHGLHFIALRYFNAAGADPEGDVGEIHDPETHLIPLAIEAALQTRPHLTIFGNDYPTPDGTCLRDFVHVSDLAEAHVLALDYLIRGHKEDFLNLGTGKGHSVNEIVSIVEKVTSRKVPTVIGKRRPGDPPELVADNTRAKNCLGWAPKFDDPEIIIRHAFDFRMASKSFKPSL